MPINFYSLLNIVFFVSFTLGNNVDKTSISYTCLLSFGSTSIMPKVFILFSILIFFYFYVRKHFLMNTNFPSPKESIPYKYDFPPTEKNVYFNSNMYYLGDKIINVNYNL